MAIEVRMVEEYLHIRLHGTLTSEDLLDLSDRIHAVEEAQSVPPSRITDMTDLVRLEIAFPEIHALAERRRARELRAPIRSAIVTASKVQYGIARMFQTLNDHPLITIEIFHDRNAALDWLGKADASIG